MGASFSMLRASFFWGGRLLAWVWVCMPLLTKISVSTEMGRGAKILETQFS